MGIDRDREAVLWDQWPASRGALCVLYQPVVWSIANTLARRLPRLATTCADELVSMGQIGLLNALDRFDRTKNVRFTSYCGLRVRGAILDELRRLDHVPRRERERCRQREEVPAMLLVQSEVPEPCVEMREAEEEFRRDPDKFLRHLEHVLREVAELVILEERSVAEAAKILGRSRRSTTELFERLKRRLLEVFGESGVTIWGEPRRVFERDRVGVLSS